MKKLALVLACGAFMFSMGSCKKCSTCIVQNDDGDVLYTYPEACGNASEIEDYESRCDAEYGTFDLTCICGE